MSKALRRCDIYQDGGVEFLHLLTQLRQRREVSVVSVDQRLQRENGRSVLASQQLRLLMQVFFKEASPSGLWRTLGVELQLFSLMFFCIG